MCVDRKEGVVGGGGGVCTGGGGEGGGVDGVGVPVWVLAALPFVKRLGRCEYLHPFPLLCVHLFFYDPTF